MTRRAHPTTRRRGSALLICVLAALALLALAAPLASAGPYRSAAAPGARQEVNWWKLIRCVWGVGGITASPQYSEYRDGSSVNVSAETDAYHHFVKWTGDLSGTNPFQTVIMTSDKTIVAHFAPNQYKVTVTMMNRGGSVLPQNEGPYDYGTKVTYKFLAAPGYEVGNVIVDGEHQGPMSSWTFPAIDRDHTIKVMFTQFAYLLYPSWGDGGSISPRSPQSVYYGGSRTFTMVPDKGYHVSRVYIDGVNYGPLSSYEFINVSKTRQIYAEFAINWYTISTSVPGGHGAITPAGPQSVQFGDSASFTMVPDPGYVVKNVTVDGLSEGAITSYTFNHVSAPHEIQATFVAPFHTISASAGVGGTISPAGSVKVRDEGSQAFSFAPAAGYQIANVVVDGTSLGSVSTYNFGKVTADHSISVAFSRPLDLTILSPSGTTQWKYNSACTVRWRVNQPVSGGVFSVWLRDLQSGVQTGIGTVTATGGTSYSLTQTIRVTSMRSYAIMIEYGPQLWVGDGWVTVVP